MEQANEPSRQKQLFKAEECAELYAGVSVRTWWKLVSCGEAPQPIRVGARSTRWRRSDLEQWLAAGCKVAKPK